MSNKVTIIGAGSVGSTIAYNMVVTGIASEIVLIDINAKKAEGEAMDILQGVPFCSPVSIYAGTCRCKGFRHRYPYIRYAQKSRSVSS